MRNRIGLSLSAFTLLLGSGCYVNRAALDPWGYAPSSSDQVWTPKKLITSMVTQAPEGPEIPYGEHPLSLAELIDVALLNNTQTKQTWAQARAAAAQYGQSQSQFFPSLDGNFSFLRTRDSSLFTGAGSSATTTGNTANAGVSTGNQLFIVTFNEWGPQLALNYVIFDFGQRRASSESARQALYYADYTHNRNIQTLLQTITTDYYHLLYEKQLLDAYAQNVETAQVTLDAATLGLDTGVKDVSDTLQAKTQFLQNEIQYVGQKQLVQNSYASLLSHMGLPANKEFPIEPLPTALPLDDDMPMLETLLSTALQFRPDYLAAQAEYRSKEQSVKAAKAQNWPTVKYTLDFGRTYYSGGLNDNYDYTSTFSLSVPIFSGYYYMNNIKIAEANKEQAQAEMDQVELQVIKDVTTSHYNVQIAFETLKCSVAYYASAKEQYTVALAQYKQGTNTILDVVSAQSSLADARAQKASAIQGWYSSLTSLAYALGCITKPSPANEDGTR